MALATQCPHCNTLFRVAHDQLKLRGGIVRCGACNEIFDGNAALVEVAAGNTPPPPTPASLAAALSATAAFDAQVKATEQAADKPEEGGPVYTLDFNSTFDPLGILPKVGEEETTTAEPDPRQTQLNLDAAPKGDPDLDLDFDVDEEFSIPPTAPTATIDVAARLERVEPRLDMVIDEPSTPPPPPVVPSVRIEPVFDAIPAAEAAETVMPVALDDVAEHVAEPEIEAAPTPAPMAPMTEDDDAGIVINLPLDAPNAPPDLSLELAPPMLEMEEPGFVKRSRQQEKWRRAGRWLMGIGSVLLLATALVQGMREFRNELAAQFPPLRLPLQSACRLLACQVQLPTQISKLSIDLGELQALPGGMFSLTTQLHNQSGTVQTWPHIDLLLKDPAGKQLLRRVVTPGEYLPTSTDPSRGFPPRNDQNIKLYFALDQIQASDYNIVVFYP
jgi:predicted Zn finger-like uncharacterized protein